VCIYSPEIGKIIVVVEISRAKLPHYFKSARHR